NDALQCVGVDPRPRSKRFSTGGYQRNNRCTKWVMYDCAYFDRRIEAGHAKLPAEFRDRHGALPHHQLRYPRPVGVSRYSCTELRAVTRTHLTPITLINPALG